MSDLSNRDLLVLDALQDDVEQVANIERMLDGELSVQAIIASLHLPLAAESAPESGR